MANALDDLWGKVLWCPAVRVGFRARLMRRQPLLGQTEVRDLDVPLVVKEHVLGFEVAVDDPVLVEAAESLDQLGRIETCSSFAELRVLAQMVEQLTTVEEVHDEVELGGRLEGVMQLHNERTVDLLENVSLSCQDNDEGHILNRWQASSSEAAKSTHLGS